MPEFNTAEQSETFRDTLLNVITLAENDLSRPRILAVSCALLGALLVEYIASDPANEEGLTLAKANIESAHAYFSSLDTPVE